MLSTGPICGLCGAASRTAWYILPWAMSTWRGGGLPTARARLCGGGHPPPRGGGGEGVPPRAPQRLHDAAVVLDLLLVPAALLRLDAAPLDREAVGVVAQLFGDREVLLEPVVVVAGPAGGGGGF